MRCASVRLFDVDFQSGDGASFTINQRYERFRWITKPGNDIYFVSMTNWIDTEERLATLDHNGALKLLYAYRLWTR